VIVMYKHEMVKNTTGFDMMINIEYGNEGISCAKHWHEHLEIIYILRDTMKIEVENSSEILQPGDFVVINSQDIHATEAQKGRGFMLLQIPFEFLKKYVPEIGQIKFNCQRADPKSEVVRSLLKKISETYEEKQDGYLLKFHGLIFQLLYTLLTEFSTHTINSEYGKSEKYRGRLSEILNYINVNYAKECSMQEAAHVMNLNSSYFSRFFKKYMGMTFMEYLSEVRIEHVFKDMMNTDLNITDICARNGFANYRIFSLKFKQKYGCTPGKKLRELRSHTVQKHYQPRERAGAYSGGRETF